MAGVSPDMEGLLKSATAKRAHGKGDDAWGAVLGRFLGPLCGVLVAVLLMVAPPQDIVRGVVRYTLEGVVTTAGGRVTPSETPPPDQLAKPAKPTSVPLSYTTIAERAEALLSAYPLVDGHTDVPMQLRLNPLLRTNFSALADALPVKTYGTYTDGVHVDLAKLRQGKVAAQVWAAWVPPEAAEQDAVSLGLQQLEMALSAIDAHPEHLALARTPDDISRLFAENKVAVVLGVEGGHMLGSDLRVLRAHYRLGVRILTLTHTGHTPWVTSCAGWTPELGGLSAFGKTVIRDMNRMGMVVDLSHVSEATMMDVLDWTAAPVVWSHSNAYQLCANSRNVPDRVLARVAQNGGLVMVTFPKQFLTCEDGDDTPKAGLVDVVAHINYLVEKVGVAHVGIGSDFDGCKYIPVGLEHVGLMPKLVQAVLATGRYSDQDMQQILGGNFLRVWRMVQDVAALWSTPAVHGAEANLYTSRRNQASEQPAVAPACHFQWKDE